MSASTPYRSPRGHATQAPNPRHDRISRLLLGLAAAGALVAMIGAAEAVGDADTALTVTAVHDLLGFPVFAGLFALLAWRPRHYPGVWEIVIVQKALISIALFGWYRDADGAMMTAWSDAILTVGLIAAYVLSQGWRGWQTARET